MTRTPLLDTGWLDNVLGAWLQRQRWFAGKGQPFIRPRTVHRIPCPDRAAQPAWDAELLVVQVTPVQTDASDHYLVPIGIRRDVPPHLAARVIARRDGWAVYDALADPDFVRQLTGDLLAGREPGEQLTVRTEPGAAPTQAEPGTVRLLSGEQSNTSVVVGDSVVLKVFRRLRQGENPESEMLRLLTRTGEPHVPPLLATLDGPLRDGTATYGTLQRFLPEARDGWSWALERADEAIRDGTGAAEENFTAEAFRLGQAVAAVHHSLAQVAPTSPLTGDDLRATGRRMQSRLVDVVRIAPRLATTAGALDAVYENLADSTPKARAQRLHGDLHLGQVLSTTAGWSVIDFEGEPDRTLAQRRALEPVAKDIAGILRSFDYAAHHQLLHARGPDGTDRRAQEAAGHAWVARNQRAFCDGYAHESGDDPRRTPALLRAYLTDKAVYELAYEIRNRPEWSPIPMRALERLARAGADDALPPGP